ncbi:MAG: helix-turn-helix transcriptional regulator [Clostridia bacterium]|nr:helix-turn-helix transcriptional regulator [Clostridia bacterium]
MQEMHVFAQYIRTEEIMFKHAKGMRDIIGLEFHPYHEIFLFMGGDAEFISNAFRARLQPRTLVVIPKENFHHFVVHGAEEDYHRYVFNFTAVEGLDALIEEKMDRLCYFPASPSLCAMFEKLGSHTADADTYKQALLQRAIFTEILLEMETAVQNDTDYAHLSVHPLIAEAVKFIQMHTSTITQVEDVAKAVNISSSYLSHLFREELHISPHRYILEKKLILANRRIEGGCGAVQAAAECGFANYSGFYKMYKKMFGFPPSMAGKSKAKMER